MSRLIVQNLPKYLTEGRLKEHFEAQGEVTDVCIIRAKNGLSRRFGFVGYVSEEQARKALKYFHQTFIDTTKISVTIAHEHGSSEISRPWSKYSKGSSRFESSGKKPDQEQNKDKNEPSKGKNGNNVPEDPMFQEFLVAVQPRSQSKFWANDDAVNPDATKEVERKNSRKSGGNTADSAEAAENITTTEEMEENDDEKIANNKQVSDIDYLRLLKKNGGDKDEITNEDDGNTSEEERTGDESHGKELLEKATKPKTTSEQNVPTASARLFVRNLAYTIIEDDLKELFESYGELTEVHLPLSDTKRTKGFAFVAFATPEAATNARLALDKRAFQGRLLHILPANPAKNSLEQDMNDDSLTYKEKKDLERKQNIKKDGWNASYIRGDTTVDCLSARFGVGKGDILDKETGSMAVRLAIGETLLLKENKEFFLEQGVDLNALEGAKSDGKKVERSANTLLVKNLPFSTNQEELSAMFEKFGDVNRFVLPPSKTLALVEFLEPSEARKAFRSLAYKKYQHVPLYLEWAPVQVFTSKANLKELTKEGTIEPTAHTVLPEIEDEDAVEQVNTIFVKNLSFSSTEANLRKLFEKCGNLRNVSIAKKKDPKKPDSTLSMGFGFVEFKTKADTQKALSTLQGAKLDGHALQLKLSQKKTSSVPKKSDKDEKLKSKIIVRNVAFEATVKDIRELFSAFGQLKQVRLPKTFDGKHRGFAFVEFLTEQEAKNAFSSLKSSHLYGRHLVLEWASDAVDIESLREKASRDLSSVSSDSRSSKKQKHDDFDFSSANVDI